MNISILLELLLAHLFSDFVLQWGKMVEKKKEGSLIYLCLHSLIHAIVAYVVVRDFSNWAIPVIIFVTHLVIDYVKYKIAKDGLVPFIVDQLLHITVIVALWQYFYVPQFNVDILLYLASTDFSTDFLLGLMAFIMVWKPTSIIITAFISKWTKEVNAEKAENGVVPIVDKMGKAMTTERWNGLRFAGEWIGYFERSLIIVFILTDNIEGVGFLLAAKSVFRYGELSNRREVSITEYVLLGTLSSFAIAVFVGFAFKYLIAL